MRKWNLLLIISIWNYFFIMEVMKPTFESFHWGPQPSCIKTNKLNLDIFKWNLIGPVWSWPKKWKLNYFLEFNRLESGAIFSPQFVLCRMSAAGAHPLWAQIIGDASLFHIVTIHRVHGAKRRSLVNGARSSPSRALFVITSTALPGWAFIDYELCINRWVLSKEYRKFEH